MGQDGVLLNSYLFSMNSCNRVSYVADFGSLCRIGDAEGFKAPCAGDPPDKANLIYHRRV